MTSARDRRFILVTSGPGREIGGVGVVAQMLGAALREIGEVTLVRHDPRKRAYQRLSHLALQSTWELRRRPTLFVYDHVDLARMSVVLPWLSRVPYVAFLHGTEVWRPLDPLRRRALQDATLLLTNSSTTLRTAREYNPWLPSADICWLGVGHKTPREPAGTRPANALIVARMDASERYKGHDAILDAWPLITAAVPEAHLHVVGSGSDAARLRERAANECLVNYTFHGQVPDDTLEDLYRTSRLFLFPSRREGFGLAAIEAALGGSAVLGLADTVLDEVFADTLVRVSEVTGPAIARAAVPILADPACAAVWAARARARVEEHFLEANFRERALRALSRVVPR